MVLPECGTYVERSQRLLDNGQYDSRSIRWLEGLAKIPDNVSLLLRQAPSSFISNQSRAAAAETLRRLLQKQPGIWAIRS